MDIRNFKFNRAAPGALTAPEGKIEFTCEARWSWKVDWNRIEGYFHSAKVGPLKNDVWYAEWVMISQRGGKEVKRRMKLSERSKAISRAIDSEVALYLASNGAQERGPQKSKKDWPAKSSDPVALSKEDSELILHNIEGGPKKDPLEMPEFLCR